MAVPASFHDDLRRIVGPAHVLTGIECGPYVVEGRTPEAVVAPGSKEDIAAILMAGLDGVQNKMDPGDPLDVNIYELAPEEASKVKRVPGSLGESLDALEAEGPAHVVLLAPDGRRFDQRAGERLAGERRLVLCCGRYEGIDERVRSRVDEVLSIGDFVLAGGEAAALVVLDAVARLVPGVMGNTASAADESFAAGLLEYPQYTRPAVYRGLEVPEVLRSGDHAAIARWRRTQAIERTRRLRPDLLDPDRPASPG